MRTWWACRFLTSISDELHPLFHHDKIGKRRIEIIGASIQAGFGDLGNNATCSESPTAQDTTLASGGDVARYFGAQYNNIAFQGTGAAYTDREPLFYQCWPSMQVLATFLDTKQNSVALQGTHSQSSYGWLPINTGQIVLLKGVAGCVSEMRGAFSALL